MFCANCGSPVADGARFCDNCGSPVAAPVSDAQANKPEPSSPSPAELAAAPAVGPDASPAFKNNAVAAAAPAAAGNDFPKKKKAAVVMAVISLILGAVGPYLDELGFFVFMSKYYSVGEYFSYLFNHLFSVCLDLTLPLILGGLFVLFCARLGKFPTLLTGIPKAVSTLRAPSSVRVTAFFFSSTS